MTPPPPPHAVELHDLWFSYGERPVLEQVTLTIPAGEMVSVVGPNGGGKTTFLRLCLGLLRPSRGQIHVLGRLPEQARGQVGYVPQNFSFDFRFPATVLDVVRMGRLGRGRAFGFFSAEDRRRAMQALEEVALADLAGRPVAALSGGQRQRVLIARALCTDPGLLLLDEPTAGIDAASQQELTDLLQRIRGQMTVILVTHDLNFVHGGTERVLCINRRAAVHPTSELSSESASHLYGGRVRLVHHDRSLDHEGL